MHRPPLAEKDYDRAITSCKKLVKRFSDGSWAYQPLGEVYLGLGRNAEAIDAFDRVISDDPKNLKAYVQRANAYYGAAKYQKAIEDYTTLIAVDSTNAIAYLGRARCLQYRNQIMI